jgi:hypothetical protein
MLEEAMQFLKIWLLCIIAAVVYGIIHDQITARLCVEYFTIGHPPVFHTSSPTLLAFGWGVIATWWMGAFLGLIVALCARFGSEPKTDVRALINPILTRLLVMAVCALLAGAVGYQLAKHGRVSLADWEYVLDRERVNRFIADSYAHLASYCVGFLGGLSVCGWILVQRVRASATSRVGAEAPLPPAAV